MKLFILLICCISVFYVGYLFTKFYQKKLIIFSDLLKLCDVLESEIKFKKNVVSSIIKNNRNLFSKEFNSLIDDYYFHIKSTGLFNYYLSSKEETIIKNLFKDLGKFDVAGEVKNINANKNLIKLHHDNLIERNKKEGMLGVKLGVLSALLILIIFI